MKLSDEGNKEAIRKASDEMVLEIEQLNAKNNLLHRQHEETQSEVTSYNNSWRG